MSASDGLLAAEPAAVLAASRAENFPVALRVLPAALRRDLEAVYAYARLVDDIGDGALIPEPDERGRALDVLDRELELVWTGSPTLPVLTRLAVTVSARALPPEPFRDLLAAQRLDLATDSYADFAALRAGCRLSADPVGRIVLGLFDVTDTRAVALSDDVCTGLQVLEHLQDVGEDARSGRVYLPQDALRARGVVRDDLLAPSATSALRAVVLDHVATARGLLGSGAALLSFLPPLGRVAVSAFTAGGMATADAVAGAGGEVLAAPVRPSRLRTARHAVRLLARRRGAAE